MLLSTACIISNSIPRKSRTCLGPAAEKLLCYGEPTDQLKKLLSKILVSAGGFSFCEKSHGA